MDRVLPGKRDTRPSGQRGRLERVFWCEKLDGLRTAMPGGGGDGEASDGSGGRSAGLCWVFVLALGTL